MTTEIMKKFLLFYLLITSLTVTTRSFASDYEYDVEGYNEDGKSVYGEIEANKDEQEVEGYIYDEEGNEVYFEGEWTGYGEIEGYDENGNYIELETE
ncbi:MAG: hypothetical protein GY928_29770 [Colwellia sp.]|nr:hypothetical protein [Colwellia sp.]